MPTILAIDQGTTSSRALLFADGKLRASHAIESRTTYPANGWVEQNAEDIWQATLACCRAVLKTDLRPRSIGITNQRETSILWDRRSGQALHPAIIWQDRRTAARCRQLQQLGREDLIRNKTGLLLDPYFSASKLEWLLDHVPLARQRAERGELAFGTIDSWLIYKLTKGRHHLTDVTNASRTSLMNLATSDWDDALLELFNIPRAVLPKIQSSTSHFGDTDKSLFGAEIPIMGVAGDQQSAMVGQACFQPGDVKSTYGTGCFALVHCGNEQPVSENSLLTTAACTMDERPSYAIEGSIFVAGAVVQWLRDAMGLIRSASEIEALARTAKDADGLYFVPAFTGLGAPYWDAEARGTITGITHSMGGAEIARAALDAVCYQTRDLLDAMTRDMKKVSLPAPNVLKVDGGMVRNDWFCQRLSDLTGLMVERPLITETTALGAYYLAGLGAGQFHNSQDIAQHWALDRRFAPALPAMRRDTLYDGWTRAVQRSRGEITPST